MLVRILTIAWRRIPTSEDAFFQPDSSWTIYISRRDKDRAKEGTEREKGKRVATLRPIFLVSYE